jgi:uncharacterized membrane protein
MSLLYRIGLVTQAIFYVAAGVNHFWHTGMYVAIMPPHYSHPVTLVQISGVAEILGGVGLLLPQIRRFAAWGIIAMLVVYFDVHVFMAMHPERFATIPVWLLYGRIPLQFVLIAWAAVYAKRDVLTA